MDSASAPPPSAASRQGCGGESPSSSPPPSRYESQKRRDWNTFLQYLMNNKPPLTLARCSGAHVIDFMKYLDQFGKTKVNITACPHFGHVNSPVPCSCPLKQAWGSLDALIGRLRAAYEENGGRPESKPFGAKAVRIYLKEVRDGQAKARGIPSEKKKKKKRKRPTLTTTAVGVNVSLTATQPVRCGGGSGGDDYVGDEHVANVGAATTTSV